MGSEAALTSHFPSPSTRREWIEIIVYCTKCGKSSRLPPHGGSGLKCLGIQRDGYTSCLPPHGGSGLKSFAMPGIIYNGQSPSTRREWIEMIL